MNPLLEEVQYVWQNAHCLWNRQEITCAMDALAKKVSEKLHDENPVVLVVMTGGMVFATELMIRLPFPLTVEYIQVSRYGDQQTGRELVWKTPVPAGLSGRNVLLVDDILDEGITLQALIAECLRLGAASVQTAVLAEKQHERKAAPEFHANFTALTIPDCFIFGYGMDYRGYLRNAPGIYALKADVVIPKSGYSSA
ncbi:Hypoxanthine phosphoribosyltransferase [gamma proteobacterium HdN1]|nr:Hypoxanthine phosphoribosyltransferase [gamma proteobacterium HdN1]